MKKKRMTGRIRYKSAAIKLKRAVAVLMAALMMGSAVDYTAFPAAYAAEDVTGEQVAELTQNGKTTVYSSFMEAYQAITTSDKATIKLLQDSRISKITGSKYITYITDKETYYCAGFKWTYIKHRGSVWLGLQRIHLCTGYRHILKLDHMFRSAGRKNSG